MLALVVEFRIKPEFIAAFDAAIDENARLSRDTEPGCREFDVCRDPGDAATARPDQAATARAAARW